MRTIRRRLVGVFFLALPAWLGGAQPASDAVFIDRVDVNVINVEVFVTDKDGRRVTDLTVDDFEIFEDGRPVEISNFYKVARAGVEADFDRDRELVAGRARPPRPELPEDQKLNLLVYVDNFNLYPASRNKVLSQMQAFLEDRLTQGDNVMMVTHNLGRVRVIEPFTRERERIFDAIKKIRKSAAHRPLDERNRREVIRNMNTEAQIAPSPQEGFGRAQEHLEIYAQSAQHDLERSLEALRNVTRSLAGLPGRKAILYVSDGLAQLPGQELYDHLNSLFPVGSTASRFIDEFDYHRPKLYNDLVADANAHQVTFYTLDARGSTGGSMLSAENETLGAAGGGMSELDSIRNANLQAPMIDMAERTGGTAIRNTANFDGALDRISKDFDSFYSLGYRSPRGGDGKFHRIRVKVKRSGVRVRHRSGYLDKPEVERVADRTLSSLMLELEKNPLGVGMDFGPPQKGGRGRFVLPVVIRIPIKDLTLLPHGEVEEGRLSIFLAVRDEQGGMSKLHQIPLPISFPRDRVARVRNSEIGYRTNLEIRAGTPKIAVGVWDELSGVESFVHKRVQVGKEKKRG